MDDQRFDAFTRSLAAPASRRRFLAALGGLAVALGLPGQAGAKPAKVKICHKGKTKKVAKKALKAHLRHGDTRGPCCDSGRICEDYFDPTKQICCPNATDGCTLFEFETGTVGTACCPAEFTCQSNDDSPGPFCCSEELPCADNGGCCASAKSCFGFGGINVNCCPNATDTCVDPDIGANTINGECCPPERACANSAGGSFECCEGTCVDGVCVS